MRKQGLGRPRREWGLASARYHAFHHSDPDDPTFTYAESWTGFDRLLERFHPWLVKLTVDHRAQQPARNRTGGIGVDESAVSR